MIVNHSGGQHVSAQSVLNRIYNCYVGFRSIVWILKSEAKNLNPWRGISKSGGRIIILGVGF